MSVPEIDFHKIRPHRNTRHGGFEELSVQLFRTEAKSAIEFTRIEGAGGDGGVEAFATLKDGSEIGLQSKFFERLGTNQWQQLQKSVKSALANHARLAEYRIVVPLNRTPANKRKWDTVVKEWQTLAKKTGFRKKLRFTWWGASELEHFLTTPEHSHKLLYWFGCHQFSDNWIDTQNQAALADLDCRYTPQHHVLTASEKFLHAVARTEQFSADFYKRVRNLFNASRKLSDGIQRDEQLYQLVRTEYETFSTVWRTTSGDFGNGKTVPLLKKISELCNLLRDAGEPLRVRISDLDAREANAVTSERRNLSQGRYDYILEVARRFLSYLTAFDQFAQQFACADSQKVLVIGPAGAGKSHLFATAVSSARGRGQPAVISLGEHFLSSDEPWRQLISKLGWEGTVTEFLSALNHAADICGRPALICIDALNESSERALWRSHLNGFASRIEKFPSVRLLVSCRDDFIQHSLPEALANGSDSSWTKISHAGFGSELFDAVATYFNGYAIQAEHFPPLLEEFRNPLFLKTFCEAFAGSTLPRGSITLDMVMKRRLSNVCKKLTRDIDCPAEVTRQAIKMVAKAIQDNCGQAVPRDDLRLKVDALYPRAGDSTSLYRHLKSNGFMVEVGSYYFGAGSEPDVRVRFPYERFSDYFIADQMLKSFKTAKELKNGWRRDGTLNRLKDEKEFWKVRGLMRALAILIPERFGIELADLIQCQELRGELYADFLDSLPWRSPESFSEKSRALLRGSEALGLRRFLQAMLCVSTIPGHPYNADYLHGCLKRMKLPIREGVWTIEISNLTMWGDQSIPDLLVKWAFRVPKHLVSDEQAILIARILAWFCSSNHRAFRLRATLAAIRILNGRWEQVACLVEEFYDCNDPYVVERVYAVACGVAMREKTLDGLQNIATVVYKRCFAGSVVPAHILLRDYAQCILELARHRGCLPDGISPEQFRPRFRSKLPRIWSEEKVRLLENDDGWRTIRSSLAPECTGWYGDFGRYVMQYAVGLFSAVPLRRKFQKGDKKSQFDAMTARRWILQRIQQLGWTPDQFEKYERNLPCQGRQRVDIEELRGERISKKYQWIALRELQAYLADHYHLAIEWGEDEPEPFRGAWQVGCRDFDPSQPLHDLIDEEEMDDSVEHVPQENPSWNCYPDPFTNERLRADRETWVVSAPQDFRTLIEIPSFSGHPEELVSLAGFYNWKEELSHSQDEAETGTLRMWAHIRSWLVRKENLEEFVSGIKQLHFWGNGCDLTGLGRGWIGEYAWGESLAGLRSRCEQPDGWLKDFEFPVVQAVCHQEEKVWAIFPSPQLCDILGARWAGADFDFVDGEGTLLAFSPGARRGEGTPPCLVPRAKLVESLRQAGWEIVWGVVGEKFCYSSEASRHIVPKDVQFSGVFHLAHGKLVGGITKQLALDIGKKQDKSTLRTLIEERLCPS